MSAIHARLKKFIVAHPSSHHDFRHQLDFLSRMHDNFDDLVLSLIQKAIDTKITQVATTTTETNTTTTTAAITSTATTTTPAINNQEIDDADQQDTLMAIDVLVPALSWSEKYAFFSLIWLYFSEKQKTITCLKVVEMLLRATHTKAQEDQFQWIKNQIKSMFKMSVQEGVGDLVLQAFGTIESICVFGEVGEADKAALKQWYNKQAGKVFVSPILAKRYSFLLNE